MINAVGDAASHSFCPRARFACQREDASADSGRAACNGPMAPEEKATGGRNMYGKDNMIGHHPDARVRREG